MTDHFWSESGQSQHVKKENLMEITKIAATIKSDLHNQFAN